jgi:DNA-binding IclR family transcriptional regulator
VESLGTVDKAIDVLLHLHAEPGPCGVTAIGRALAMPKSSVHRLLASLTRRGLVERDDRGRYRPGVRLVALGLGVLEREPLVIAARPVLERLAQDVGETFFLVSARAGSLVVLEKAEGTGFLRAAPRVGSVVPVHATAVGKLYLAFAPDVLAPAGAPAGHERSAAHAAARSRATSGLEAFTDATTTDPEALAREIEGVRERGLASNRDEWIPGLSVLAAPIRLGERMTGAVALALATPSLAARSLTELEDRVRGGAAAISARLSGAAGPDA